MEHIEKKSSTREKISVPPTETELGEQDSLVSSAPDLPNFRKPLLPGQLLKKIPYGSRFVPEIKTAIIEGFRRRLTIKRACFHAGIHHGTFNEWRKLAEAEIRESEENGTELNPEGYGRFLLDCEKAVSESLIEDLDRIEELASGGQVVKKRTYTRKDGTEVTEEEIAPPSWQGFSWLVERRHPEYRNNFFGVEGEGRRPTLQVVYVGDWRQTNAESGHILQAEDIIEAKFIESDGKSDQNH